MGKEINKVLNSIYSFDEKVGLQNLESHSVELALVDDLNVKIKELEKEVENSNIVFNDLYSVMKKSQEQHDKIIVKVGEVLRISDRVVDISKDLGVPIPKEVEMVKKTMANQQKISQKLSLITRIKI
jgi:hypothetical protein